MPAFDPTPRLNIKHMSRTPILIVGGSVGGCAAALAACRMGARVILTEESAWIGGQFTSQAVPPDENPWVERGGCTAAYRGFREQVRSAYQTFYPWTDAARSKDRINPGEGAVSGICHDATVSLHVLQAMLRPWITAGRLTVLTKHEPVAAQTDADRITAVELLDTATGDRGWIEADYILDATELGDLLPLAGAEYRLGTDARATFDEPHAPDTADPNALQAITWCTVLGYDPTPGADHTIDKPQQYDRWAAYVPDLSPPWAGPLLSWDMTCPFTLGTRRGCLHPEDADDTRESFWLYRRVIAAQHYTLDPPPHEASVINWPSNDYWLGSIIDQPDGVAEQRLHDAKQLTRSLIYWLQTAAPRFDGSDQTGYPGLYPRPDLTGSADGLALRPYIREARRLQTVFTVTENHVGVEARGGVNLVPGQPPPKQPAGLTAEQFPDSVGIGSYRIDLHPDTAGRNYLDIASLPFQIPLGTLVPVRLKNLLPACKNLGVTHITNGCYRLHPVEWNIGESAGALAAWCLAEGLTPHQVHAQPTRLQAFQNELAKQGVPLGWPEDVATQPR